MRPQASGQKAVAVCIDTRDGAGRRRLHGVAQYARRPNWRMMLVRSGGRAAAREVLRLRPHGIVAYIADRWLVEAAKKLRVPLVDTAWSDVPVTCFVTLDSDAVGQLAAEHLASAGLRHFAYCGVQGKIASVQRRESFAAHLNRLGHSLSAFSQHIAEGESQMEPLQRWLRGLPKPTGLLCFDDKLGERVLTACRWSGLSVPEQVAVLGIGDDELMCEVSWPSLSSINGSARRMGLEAAEMLDRAMNRRPVSERVRKVMPTSVSARMSTDVVAVDDALIKAAVQLIRQRGSELGVEQMASMLNVSRRTLDRRFADILGRTVHDVLAMVRMQCARGLLIESGQSIAEIAAACGYSSGASFSRAFREHAGCWPTEFRSEARVI